MLPRYGVQAAGGSATLPSIEGGVLQPAVGAVTMMGWLAVPLAGSRSVSRQTLPQASCTVSPAANPDCINRASVRHGPVAPLVLAARPSLPSLPMALST